MTPPLLSTSASQGNYDEEKAGSHEKPANALVRENSAKALHLENLAAAGVPNLAV